jgi:non-ribosomal peptide synthetase component F
MEEIWIPYLAGATLFVATPQIIGEMEALPDILEEVGVTVLDTVPTLLTVLPRDVKTIKKILLGGEACPPSIAESWTPIGRTIYNTYGPTETTVVATVAEVRPKEPVTIGRRSRITHATSSMKNSNCCRPALKANCSLADRASRAAICNARR